MNEERNNGGQMRILGASNEFIRGRSQGRSTLDTKDTKGKRSTIFNNANLNGIANRAFIAGSSDEDPNKVGGDQEMEVYDVNPLPPTRSRHNHHPHHDHSQM